MVILGQLSGRDLVLATWWAQAGTLKLGQDLRLQLLDGLSPTGEPVGVRLVSRKNLGTYGSGCTLMIVEGLKSKQEAMVRGWSEGKVVRARGLRFLGRKGLRNCWPKHAFRRA